MEEKLVTVKILEIARQLIASGWTQGAYARDESGKEISDYFRERPAYYCVTGAILVADKSGDSMVAAFAFLHASLPPSNEVCYSLPSYNDNPNTTQADVVALYDRAIALAQAAA